MQAHDVSARLIRVPVRYNAGKLEFLHGGPMPAIADGAICDLVVPEDQLRSSTDVAMLTERAVVGLLDEGDRLLAEVSMKSIPAALRQAVLDVRNAFPPPQGGLVEIVLEEPLRIELRGTTRASLLPVRCRVGALDAKAASVNHAFRLISEVFEPHRRSHATNVFETMYCMRDGRWILLEELRQAKEAEAERALIKRWSEK